MSVDLSKAKKLIKKFGNKKGSLIPILQEIQKQYGYVPSEAVDLIAKELNIFPTQIYGVLTFYKQFYLTPRGKHVIRVCQGTACHVMGGKELLELLCGEIGINEGETTKDGHFSIERVACLGCCGMAPVIVVNDDFYGNCTFQKVEHILQKYKNKGGK